MTTTQRLCLSPASAFSSSASCLLDRFAGCVLGYFGAEVIKVEPLTGDPLRNWRVLRDGTSLWWYSLARNKKSVAIDLQTETGRELVRKLAMQCDVLIENFKPGTMEKWGLGPEQLKALRPDLIYTRVSGYGQTGPYASKPGFASVCEAIGGLRYVNGFADRRRCVRTCRSAIRLPACTR